MSIHAYFVPNKQAFYVGNEESVGFFESEHEWTMDYWTSRLSNPSNAVILYCKTDLTPSSWELAAIAQ